MSRKTRYIFSQCAVVVAALLWLLSGCGGSGGGTFSGESPTFGSSTPTFSSASPSVSPSTAACTTTVSLPNPLPNVQQTITVNGPANTQFTAVANYRSNTSSTSGTTNGSGVANFTFNSGSTTDAGFVVVVNITFNNSTESCQATWQVQGAG